MTEPRDLLLSLAGLLGLLAAGPAAAAPVTWADPAGLCNGQAPCFTTLTAAVANAGPPPATVFVFPGTYAESVDLGQMGSAIGGGPGELAVVSVDGAGQPAPGAVVDAGAPGGPGTGRAIEAILFPGALTLDGLVLRSPDTHGLIVAFSAADVILRRLTASGNPGGSGIRVFADDAVETEITAEDLRADSNGGDGLLLGAVRVVATGLVANQNGADGMRLNGREVSGQSLVAEGNTEVGVEVGLILGAATFDLSQLTLRANETGLVVFPDVTAEPARGTLSTVAAAGNANIGILVFCDELTASDLASTQNGDGILLVVNDRIEATDLGAVGNTGIGIVAFASEVRLSSSVAEQNLIGIAVGGDFVVLEGSTASDNGPAGPEPFDGTGFAVLANRLEATGNLASGNLVGWIFDDTDPLASLLAALPPGLSALTAQLARKGGPLPPQRLTLRRTVTEGNQSFSMGVRLRPEGHLSIACSDFIGNGQPGLDLQTSHTLDARFNFWGHPSGPDHPGNPGGTGDPIQDDDNGGFGTVLFGGFLTGPATDADCPAVPLVEVPALGSFGLLLLAALVAGLALRRLRA